MSHGPVSIRPARLGDADTVVAFNAAMAWESEALRLDPATLSAGVRRALADPAKCLYFIADIDGRTVGQTMVTYEWSDWRNAWLWWIQSVYVIPEARRKGVFRRLYAHVREAAMARGDVCGLRLYVHRANAPAIQTYQRLGMTLGDYLVCQEDWGG